MPQKETLLTDLQKENSQFALLLAQVGASPTEIQIVCETAVYDNDKEGLIPQHSYIIRALGVLEHRVETLGTTVGNTAFLDTHPLLMQYNERPTALFFRGQAEHIDSLILDLIQAYDLTMHGWRQFPDYLNIDQPLSNLFASGGGMLGQLPQSLAHRLMNVLDKHHLETKLMQDKAYAEKHDNPALSVQRPQLLLMGTSYIISYAFSVEFMGKN